MAADGAITRLQVGWDSHVVVVDALSVPLGLQAYARGFLVRRRIRSIQQQLVAMAAEYGDVELLFDGARLLRPAPTAPITTEQCAQTDESMLVAYMHSLATQRCTASETQTDDEGRPAAQPAARPTHVDASMQTDSTDRLTLLANTATQTQLHIINTRGVAVQATPGTTRMRHAGTQASTTPHPPQPRGQHHTQAASRDPAAAAAAAARTLPELRALRRDTELELLWTQQAIESRREVSCRATWRCCACRLTHCVHVQYLRIKASLGGHEEE